MSEAKEKAAFVKRRPDTRTTYSEQDQYISDYLRKKAIPLSDLISVCRSRVEIRGEVLFRELVNAANEPMGWERIWPDGTKKTTFGSTVRASFTPMGFEVGTPILCLEGTLIVCCGLADGYRIHEAMKLPVACGVGENNLKGIADSLFTCAPRVKLLVCADNDEAGIRAAKATGRRWIVPGGGINDVA